VPAYNLKPGDTVWIFQTGWEVGLPEDLQRHFAEFHDLRFESFGKNIKIFKMTVGQPMPGAITEPRSELHFDSGTSDALPAHKTISSQALAE
jgi:hypothetical protein